MRPFRYSTTVLLAAFLVSWLPYRAASLKTRLVLPQPPGAGARHDGPVARPPKIPIMTPPFRPGAEPVRLQWALSAGAGQCVRFELVRFAVNRAEACFSGYLAVFDGPDATAPMLLHLCGSPATLPTPITSSANHLHVAFYSEAPGDTTQLTRQGFLAYATGVACLPSVGILTTPLATTSPAASGPDPVTTAPDDYDVAQLATLAPPFAKPPPGADALKLSQLCGHPFFKPVESHLDHAIVGGRVALPSSWPWQASLHFRGKHTCGAVLISRLHLLSAAHCFSVTRDPRQYAIVLGRSSLDRHEVAEQRLGIERITLHPRYSRISRYDSDLCVVRLREPGAAFNAHVSPVCLPRHQPSPGAFCYVTGFGKTLQTGGDNQLKQAAVPVIGNGVCANMDSRIARLLTGNMVCAGFAQGGIDSCNGDSGGPLVCKLGSFPHYWTLNGIVSFGFSCALPNLPGIYTRVGKYIDWIDQQVSDLPSQL